MTRQIYFWNNGDVSCLGIRDYVFVLFLGIESSLSTTHLCASSVGSKIRPGFYFNAPTLIIAKMQVHHIHFIITD